MTTKFLTAFPTPMVQVDHTGVKSLNALLKEKILARREVDKGCRKSNSALTWHSNYDMKEWCSPAIEDLVGMFQKAFVELAQKGFGAQPGAEMSMRVTPWAMVTDGQGDYASPHTHPRCHFSSVYYVDPGEADYDHSRDAGKIEFFDPRNFGHMAIDGMNFSQRCVFTPQAGRMLVFPAEFPHMVHPFFGTGQRIAIASNCTIGSYNVKVQ